MSTSSGSTTPLWEGCDEIVDVAPSDTVSEIITARRIRVGNSAKLAGAVCEELMLGASAEVRVAYVASKVNMGISAKVGHLFRRQGATLTAVASASAPRTPILSQEDWEHEAREFRGY